MFFLGGWKMSWLGLNLAVEKDRREWSYLIGYQFRSTTFVTGGHWFEPPTHKIHQKPGRYVIVGTKNLQYVKLCMVRCLLSSWKLELDKKWRSMIVLLLGFCLRCLEKSKTYCPKWWLWRWYTVGKKKTRTSNKSNIINRIKTSRVGYSNS